MNHPSREEWMSYLYDELNADQSANLQAHLHTCPDCKTNRGLPGDQRRVGQAAVTTSRGLLLAEEGRGHYGGADRKRLPPRPATTGSVGRLYPTRELVEFTATLKGNKMKAFITTIVATAAITWPGAMSARGKEPPTSSTPAALAAFERDEQELDRVLAEVRQQVEVELTPKLEAVPAQAGAKVQEAQGRIDQQMAK